MRTQRTLVATATLAFAVCIGTPAAASAETLQFKARGDEAVAGFASVDGTGCVVSHVFVAAMDADVKASAGSSGPDSRSFAEVAQYDRCTQTELLHAFGETLLPPEALIISPLQSAHLVTELSVFDRVSGDPLTLSVDLTWAASGETARVKDHYQFKSPSFTVNAKLHALSVQAGAHGTVTAGGTNFTPDPAMLALLNSGKQRVLEITH